MDIHRPKAAHSIREFLIEIGTIICGILIALGLEQGIEWLHREHQAREAGEALRQELSWNLGAVQVRWRLIDCTNRRLDELDRWWESWRAGKPLSLAANIIPPRSFFMRSSVWTVASGGGVAMMPLKERVNYSRLYDTFSNHETIRNREAELWSDLAPFRWAHSLDENMLLRIKYDIEALRFTNSRTVSNRASVLDRSKALSLTEPQGDAAVAPYLENLAPSHQAFCSPLLAR